MENKIYYFNTGFDQLLGNYKITPYRKIINEIQFAAYPLGNDKDIALTEYEPPVEYLQYLQKINITYCSDYKSGVNYSEYFPEVWGWDEITRQVLKERNIDFSSPSLDIITKINSRVFSSHLAEQLKFPSGTVCYSIDEVILKSQELKTSFIVKAEFGSSGSGFVIKDNSNWNNKEFEKLKLFFSERNRAVVLEEWRNRAADYSVNFLITEKGEVKDIIFNKLLVNKRGVFSAIIVDYMDDEFKQYYDYFKSAAKKIADKCYQAGYYGPIGVDAYSYYDENNNIVFNPLSEINARRTMVFFSKILKEKIDCVCGKLLSISKKKVSSIKNYQIFEEKFKEILFDQKKKSGIIIMLPLFYYLGENIAYPERNLVFIAAQDYAGLEILTNKFYKCLL